MQLRTGSLKVALKHRRNRGLGGWRQHYYYAKENEPASAALLIEAYVKELRDGAAAEIRAIFSPCLQDTFHVTHCLKMKRLIVGYSVLW